MAHASLATRNIDIAPLRYKESMYSAASYLRDEIFQVEYESLGLNLRWNTS